MKMKIKSKMAVMGTAMCMMLFGAAHSANADIPILSNLFGGCNKCHVDSCNPCPKPKCNPCPKPSCDPCAKPKCNTCPPKPLCMDGIGICLNNSTCVVDECGNLVLDECGNKMCLDLCVKVIRCDGEKVISLPGGKGHGNMVLRGPFTDKDMIKVTSDDIDGHIYIKLKDMMNEKDGMYVHKVKLSNDNADDHYLVAEVHKSMGVGKDGFLMFGKKYEMMNLNIVFKVEIGSDGMSMKKGMKKDKMHMKDDMHMKNGMKKDKMHMKDDMHMKDGMMQDDMHMDDMSMDK